MKNLISVLNILIILSIIIDGIMLVINISKMPPYMGLGGILGYVAGAATIPGVLLLIRYLIKKNA